MWIWQCQHFACHLQQWEETGMDVNAFSYITLSDPPVAWATTQSHTFIEANTSFWLDTDRKVLNLIPVNIWEINCPQAYSVEWNDWMKCRRQMVTNWQPNILNFNFSTHLSWPFIYSLVLVSYAEICLALSGTHIEEIHTAYVYIYIQQVLWIKVKILYILNHL